MSSKSAEPFEKLRFVRVVNWQIEYLEQKISFALFQTEQLSL